MRPYTRPSLTPLGTVHQLTQSTPTPSLPGAAGALVGTGGVPLVLGYVEIPT